MKGEIKMLNTTFFLSGNVPSKKNSRQVFVKNGRVINIPSKRYKQWHDECMDILDGFGTLYPPYEIVLVFWMKDNRRTDLDNKVGSVLDLLQDAGIIEDDCWQKLKSISARAGGISKDFPRVKVEIHSGLDKPQKV